MDALMDAYTDSEEESSGEEKTEKKSENSDQDGSYQLLQGSPEPMSSPEPEKQDTDEDFNSEAACEYSSKLRRLSTAGEMQELILPPAPSEKCHPQQIEKIRNLYRKRHEQGVNMNEIIKRKKSFRNPSIYQMLIELKNINEGGSNFPKDVFDPVKYKNDKNNSYKAIALAQKKLEERRQLAMKERSKIEFAAAQKSGSHLPAVVEKNQSSSGKKSISSVGQLAKDKSKSRK